MSLYRLVEFSAKFFVRSPGVCHTDLPLLFVMIGFENHTALSCYSMNYTTIFRQNRGQNVSNGNSLELRKEFSRNMQFIGKVFASSSSLIGRLVYFKNYFPYSIDLLKFRKIAHQIFRFENSRISVTPLGRTAPKLCHSILLWYQLSCEISLISSQPHTLQRVR